MIGHVKRGSNCWTRSSLRKETNRWREDSSGASVSVGVCREALTMIRPLFSISLMQWTTRAGIMGDVLVT